MNVLKNGFACERSSLSFPPAEFKKRTAYLGKVSGRDEDKIAKSGLTPVFDAAGTPKWRLLAKSRAKNLARGEEGFPK